MVAASSSASCIRQASIASAAKIPLPPEVVTIPIRFPSMRAPVANSAPASSNASISATRAMPACRSAESTTLSADASAPVCEAAAFAPASLRPAFTTAIGFTAAALASALMSPNDSMYISTASIDGSSTSLAATSTAVTSASLPVVTAMPIGTPRSIPKESAPKPSAPD